MIIALIILGCIIAICCLLIAFFLMCIWRAILGKSSVDLKVTTGITLLMGKIDLLNKNFTTYSSDLDGHGKKLDELVQAIRNLPKENGEQKP